MNKRENTNLLTTKDNTPKKRMVKKPPPYPIVGLGASAGGLKSFESFFSGMPKDKKPDMAFVVVQHLSPDHESILTQLLQPFTSMKVFQVQDGLVPQPNSIYVMPPGVDMAFKDGAINLSKPASSRNQRLPIDHFFCSLAKDQGEKAIGIVLSGTGSDGTQGIKAIKELGGMVMVQSPESTEYAGMPQSAIDTGMVDYVLVPDQMLNVLIGYSPKPWNNNASSKRVNEPTFTTSLHKLVSIIRTQTGHDFSSYKVNPIQRRIDKRMARLQIDSIESYVAYLQQANNEAKELFNELLIGVTNFFRDPSTFDSLRELVIPKLFAQKNPDQVIRIWSVGCSTGEEAYSLAMMFHAHMDQIDTQFTIQIFATDLDAQAISSARKGIFSATSTKDLPMGFLGRYFTTHSWGKNHEVETYRINKVIRDMVIFSQHSVTKDPPFSRLDLICCRNLMIYFSNDLQKRIIPLFHYALNPHGFLWLGLSESLGDQADLFQTLDQKSKIYQRKANHYELSPTDSSRIGGPNTDPEPSTIKSSDSWHQKKKLSAQDLTERTILTYLTPSSALVNRKGDIFFLHGRTGIFLEPAVGDVGTYNIISMARQGLKNPLSSTLRKAVEREKVASYPKVKVKTNGSYTGVNLAIYPAVGNTEQTSPENRYLVVFEEFLVPESTQLEAKDWASSSGDDQSHDSTNQGSQDNLMEILKKELLDQEEYLRVTIEELETTTDELKSTNEEMQSRNEEFETSKEELQSVNEELTTVNNELSAKITDLHQANNDMNNLVAGTGIATIFVNLQLQILRFTPTASRLIHLIPGDLGRPVSHIVTNLTGYNTMVEDIQSVLTTLLPITLEVQTIKGDWFKLSILPYRTLDNVIEGAVLTFVDITQERILKDELESQLSEKVTLLLEVHHRVKNNIASIEGLLSLQTDSTTNPEVVTALQDALARVQSMRILYENLLVSKNYQKISIKSYLTNLIDSLIAVGMSDIDVQVDLDLVDFLIASNKASSIGMIVNELLTNGFKYAFPNRKKGSINISLDIQDNRVILVVQDNGVGFASHSSTGFGLSIVKMLVEQLNGTYEITSEQGTKSAIEFEV